MRNWVKFKFKLRQLFKSKKQKEEDRIVAINNYWACFSEEEKRQQMKYLNDLIRRSEYCRTREYPQA